jgi:rubrerythrin
MINQRTTQSGFLGFSERVGRDAVSVRRELVCENCGYGIRVTVPPPSCPMCQRFEWRPATQERAAAIHAVSARARIRRL